MTRRFQGGGTLLVAYTNAKLMSNTDTLTSWLEGNTGGVPGAQDWNNLAGRDLSPLRTFHSAWSSATFLTFPSGRARRIAGSLSGVAERRGFRLGRRWYHHLPTGFPLKIGWSGSHRIGSAPILGLRTLGPNVIPDATRKLAAKAYRVVQHQLLRTPPECGYGTESRVDSVPSRTWNQQL